MSYSVGDESGPQCPPAVTDSSLGDSNNNSNNPSQSNPIRLEKGIYAYSSVKGMIFFSGSSSSAKFFLYFSQFWPVALGMVVVVVECYLRVILLQWCLI